MDLYIKLKQAGKRRLVLDKQAIAIEDLPENPVLRDLIAAVVRQQAEAYNAKINDQPLVDFLTENQIRKANVTGKVGFGTVYHEGKANVEKAIENALYAHIDGLYAVAIDDKVIGHLDDAIQIQENSILMFIKLTLLIG